MDIFCNGNQIIIAVHSRPFSLMVEVLAGIKGDSIYVNYLAGTGKRVRILDGRCCKIQTRSKQHRVIKMPDGSTEPLLRDDNPVPQESHKIVM